MSEVMRSVLFAALLITALLSPALSVFSGLALVIVIGFIGVGVLCSFAKLPVTIAQFKHPSLKLITVTTSLLIGWSLLSLFWTLHASHALGSVLQVIAIVVIGFCALILVRELDSVRKEKIEASLVYGFFLAILCCFAEMVTGGVLTQQFRSLITAGRDASFEMHYLNRGATYLVLLFWPFLVAFIDEEKHRQKHSIIAILCVLWVVVFGTLLKLESLSAVVAFLTGTITFIWIELFRGRAALVVIIGTLLVLLTMPVLISTINPTKLAADNPSLPHSAVHRLYIWHFTAEKAQEKLTHGWGFKSSRHIPGGDEMVSVNGVPLDGAWTYLPLHPHNSVLQLLLELGILGLALFVSIVLAVMLAIDRTLHHPTQKAASMALVVAYITIGMTAYGFWQPWWIAAGFLASILMSALIAPVREPTHKTD